MYLWSPFACFYLVEIAMQSFSLRVYLSTSSLMHCLIVVQSPLPTFSSIALFLFMVHLARLITNNSTYFNNHLLFRQPLIPWTLLMYLLYFVLSSNKWNVSMLALHIRLRSFVIRIEWVGMFIFLPLHMQIIQMSIPLLSSPLWTRHLFVHWKVPLILFLLPFLSSPWHGLQPWYHVLSLFYSFLSQDTLNHNVDAYFGNSALSKSICTTFFHLCDYSPYVISIVLLFYSSSHTQ